MSIRSRKDLNEELLNRAQESYDTKDSSGRFGNIFKAGTKATFWKCSEGEHTIDVIPWEVGDNYPKKEYPNMTKGKIARVLDIYVHQGIGANEDTVVCPFYNYNDPCPMCEEVHNLRKIDPRDGVHKQQIKERIDKIKARRRGVYNIVCYDTDAEEDKGVQIWDVAHFFMEKHLADRSKKPKGGGFVHFAHPDEGKQVFFKRKGSGMQNTEYTSHDFLERDYIISEEVLDQAHCLDELIEVLTYEKLQQLFGKGQTERVSTPSPKQEDTPARPTRTRIPKNEAGQAPAPAAPAPAAPAPRRARRSTPAEADVPAEAAVPTPVNTKDCPGGGVFGRDTDTLDHCPSCDVWDECAMAEQSGG